MNEIQEIMKPVSFCMAEKNMPVKNIMADPYAVDAVWPRKSLDPWTGPV
jgi:hypothetical protein